MRLLLLACALICAACATPPPPAAPTLMVLPTLTTPPADLPLLTTAVPTLTASATPAATMTLDPQSPLGRINAGHTQAAPLYGEFEQIDGVETVDLISRFEGALSLEVRVRAGFNRQDVADALLAAAQQLEPDLQELGIILSESASATDYTWRARRDAWTVTPLTQFPLSTSTPAAAALTLPCNGVDDLNCADFPRNGRRAQAHLEACGNEDRLDGDGDGLACEFAA